MTTYSVIRTDDNGNIFVVRNNLDQDTANQLCKELTQRGHKQTYEVWVDKFKPKLRRDASYRIGVVNVDALADMLENIAQQLRNENGRPVGVR